MSKLGKFATRLCCRVTPTWTVVPSAFLQLCALNPMHGRHTHQQGTVPCPTSRPSLLVPLLPPPPTWLAATHPLTLLQLLPLPCHAPCTRPLWGMSPLQRAPQAPASSPSPTTPQPASSSTAMQQERTYLDQLLQRLTPPRPPAAGASSIRSQDTSCLCAQGGTPKETSDGAMHAHVPSARAQGLSSCPELSLEAMPGKNGALSGSSRVPRNLQRAGPSSGSRAVAEDSRPGAATTVVEGWAKEHAAASPAAVA